MQLIGSNFENDAHIQPFPLLVSTTELDAANLRAIRRVSINVKVLCNEKTGCILSYAPEMFFKTFSKSAHSFADVNGRAGTAGDVGVIKAS